MLTTGGAFAATVMGSGLPPQLGLSIDTSSVLNGCDHTKLSQPSSGLLIPATELASDAAGSFFVSLSSSGGCVPGTYPIIITELGSPFTVFTILLTLESPISA